MSQEHPQILEGLIEGALAGEMGKPALQHFARQVDELLAYDAQLANGVERVVAGGFQTEDEYVFGKDRGRLPNQIGWATFSSKWTHASQYARLNSARASIAALLQ